MSVKQQAIALATRYFLGQGYTVDDMSHKQGHNGYDFILSLKGKT